MSSGRRYSDSRNPTKATVVGMHRPKPAAGAWGFGYQLKRLRGSRKYTSTKSANRCRSCPQRLSGLPVIANLAHRCAGKSLEAYECAVLRRTRPPPFWQQGQVGGRVLNAVSAKEARRARGTFRCGTFSLRNFGLIARCNRDGTSSNGTLMVGTRPVQRWSSQWRRMGA